MSRNSEEAVDADAEIICIGDQRSGNGDQAEKESIKTDVKILPNQLPPQEVQMEGDAAQSTNAESEEILANIQERLQTSLCLDQQNCKEENIYGKKVVHTGQRNCNVSQFQRNDTDFTAAEIFQDKCEVSICHDVKESELKTDHQPPSQLASSAENSSQVNASLSKLQVDLKRFSHFNSRSSHKETANGLNKASERRDCTKPSSKEETVDRTLAKLSEDEGNSPGSQSEEDNSVDSNESEEGSDADGLEFDKRDTSERASEQGHFLPSVEEFEKDFEEYLENVSNVLDNSIEKLPHPSEFSDDGSIHSEYKLHSDFKDDSYDGTLPDAYVVSQQFDTLPETCYQMLHQDSCAGYCNLQCVQVQNQTDLCHSAYHENILSEGGWNYPYPYTCFCDGCYSFSNHNYSHNNYHDQSYNNYSRFHGNHAANWPANAQRHPESASSQQCLDDFYGDTGSYQDDQWNTSWYNAYQRQTNCIRQFLSFSRSARL